MDAECNGKVFISHAHDDNERCRPLLDALRRWGVDYWFDTEQLNAGHDHSRRIQQAITERDIFIRVCTGTTQERPYWIDQETGAFRGLQAEAVNTGRPDKRKLINLLLDAQYKLQPFDLNTPYINTTNKPTEEWLDDLRRALGLPAAQLAPAAERQIALRTSARGRQPVYLLIDTSGSTAGPTITAINESLRSLYLGLVSDPIVSEKVWLSVITFSSEAKQYPLVPVRQFTPPHLTASGSTSFGQALRLLNVSLSTNYVAPSLESPGDLPPLVIVLTDGQPTDSWLLEAEKLRSRAANRPTVVGVAVGDLASADLLQESCSTVYSVTHVTSSTFLVIFTKFLSSQE